MAQRRKSTKDTKAKETVSNLLKDVLPTKEEKKKDKLEIAVENKGVAWLEKDIDRLTKENEQLKADYEKLLNEVKNKPQGSDEAIKKAVLKLFRELEDAHLGRNPERVRYREAIIKVWLNKFLEAFPFISQK